MPLKEVHVLAGVIFDAAGRVLLAQRPGGKDLAGYWEFPGGKIEPGETRFDALTRELREELGIEIGPARPLTRVRHAYPNKQVLLDFWIVRQFEGEARGLDGQQLRWCTSGELRRMPLLPADQPMLRLVHLPDELRSRSGDGFSISSSVPTSATEEPTGVLCRDVAGARRVATEGADFLVLTQALPADQLTHLCLAVDVPVFAVGLELADAWQHGASGINCLMEMPSASQR